MSNSRGSHFLFDFLASGESPTNRCVDSVWRKKWESISLKLNNILLWIIYKIFFFIFYALQENMTFWKNQPYISILFRHWNKKTTWGRHILITELSETFLEKMLSDFDTWYVWLHIYNNLYFWTLLEYKKRRLFQTSQRFPPWFWHSGYHFSSYVLTSYLRRYDVLKRQVSSLCWNPEIKLKNVGECILLFL